MYEAMTSACVLLVSVLGVIIVGSWVKTYDPGSWEDEATFSVRWLVAAFAACPSSCLRHSFSQSTSRQVRFDR